MRHGTEGPPPRPGPNWTRVDERQNQTQWNRNVTVQPPTVPANWHRFETYSRQTITRIETLRVWERQVETANGTETERRRTWANETVVRNVSVAVVGRHTGGTPAPARPIRPVHQRGAGPLAGPNLAGVRERLRAVNVTMARGDVGTYEANPPAALAQRLRQRRGTLLDAPESYDSAATKARIGARAAYIDAVVAELEARARERRARKSSFDAALKDAGTSLDKMQEGLEARERPPAREQPRLSGISGSVRLSADTAPAYLTQSKLTSEQIPAVDGWSHPLVARNINVFTVPHQQAADGTVDAIFGTNSGVRLDTAARTLNATNATVRALNTTVIDRQAGLRDERPSGNETTVAHEAVKTRRQQLLLEREVTEANHYVIEHQEAVLAEQGFV